MKVYTVIETPTEFGEVDQGRQARVLGVYSSREVAQAAILKSINVYAKGSPLGSMETYECEANFGEFAINLSKLAPPSDYEAECEEGDSFLEYSIEEIEVDKTNE